MRPYCEDSLPRSGPLQETSSEERVAELTTIDWFSEVTSPESVAIAALSNTWEDFRLERRNDLTSVVAVRLQQRGSEWNKCAKAFTNFFDSYIAPTIKKRLSEIGLPDSLLDVVAWDIVNYMQELNYSDVRRPDFFGKIWTAYKQGHFPCGWEGDYPVGALITP